MRTKFKFDIPVDEFPDAIFCADLHIRDTIPICRTTTFLDDMLSKLSWLRALQFYFSGCGSDFAPPVIGAGDIFETWKLKDWWIIGQAAKLLPEKFFCVAGQHELPRHSLEFPEKSPLDILSDMGRIHRLGKINFIPFSYSHDGEQIFYYGRSWGQDTPIHNGSDGIHILVTHEMLWEKKPYPGASLEGNSKAAFNRYSDFDVIVSGDNHQPFVAEKGEQLLVNCGSMMRSSISQDEYKPCVWLYYADENKVKPLYYPLREDVFMEYDIEKAKDDDRIQDLVKKMKGINLDISFEGNVQRFIEAEKPRDRVAEILLETIGA